jgi:subtilisin family serine protease
VNNSWGNPDGWDTTFMEDLAALQAAGIFAVFSAGNQGPGPGSIASPASLPGAFAVGAVDAEGQVALFSSRGPSPWGEVRPHIVAPGVRVRSTLPGGTYGELSGTSMAAPHAAGVAALLKAARPELSPLQIAEILTRTATPLTVTVPNFDSGWGLVNAMEALSAAVESGLLEGAVQDPEGRPIAGATVTARARDGRFQVSRESDPAGRYRLFLRASTYDVTASAFGYAPARSSGSRSFRGSPAPWISGWILSPGALWSSTPSMSTAPRFGIPLSPW